MAESIPEGKTATKNTLGKLIDQEAGRTDGLLTSTENDQVMISVPLAELESLEALLQGARCPKVVFSENHDSMRENAEYEAKSMLENAHRLLGSIINKKVY